MQEARKALIAAVMPVLGAITLWVATGEVNFEELGLLIGGLVTALLVFLVPNAPANRDR